MRLCKLSELVADGYRSMFFGKIIAGFFGLLLGGLPGLLLGVLAGHFFDRGLSGQLSLASPERLARMQQTFFETAFQLLGHVAKADGRVSESEIAQAEALMRQLGIVGGRRQAAIAEFKRGAAADYELEKALSRFNQDCAGPRVVAQTLLVFVISMAQADGTVDRQEHDVLASVARYLGYQAAEFERLLQMVQAQSHFHETASAPARDQLTDAHQALGVEAGCSDRELKRAYRKLMSEHHPDKLIARGVPESMMKVATEKAQEIQAAYELIKTSRQSSR
jgi:DnaJ like chaperone protein